MFYKILWLHIYSIIVIGDSILFVSSQSLPDIILPLEVYDYPIWSPYKWVKLSRVIRDLVILKMHSGKLMHSTNSLLKVLKKCHSRVDDNAEALSKEKFH